MSIEENHPNSTQMIAMHDRLARRQDEILGSICKLVETEPPSVTSRAAALSLTSLSRLLPLSP
jgi:hypothetical protein